MFQNSKLRSGLCAFAPKINKPIHVVRNNAQDSYATYEETSRFLQAICRKIPQLPNWNKRPIVDHEYEDGYPAEVEQLPTEITLWLREGSDVLVFEGDFNVGLFDNLLHHRGLTEILKARLHINVSGDKWVHNLPDNSDH